MDIITMTFTEEEFDTLKDIFFNYSFDNTMQIKKYTEIASKYILDSTYNYDGCTLQQAKNCIKMLMDKNDQIVPIHEKFRAVNIKDNVS